MISLDKLKEEVKKAYIFSCIKLPNSVKELFIQARNKEVEGSLAQKVFDILLQNAEIAERESLPLCQDTGIPVILVRISEGLTIPTGLEKAINAGIAEAVKEGYLRASVAHPLTRENTGTNTPAVIHYEIVPGDELFEIWVMPKGCGSENMSRLAMLKPADGIEGIKSFVLETVKLAGPNPCPPLIVGVGIGGSFEHCAFLAKKALFRELDFTVFPFEFLGMEGSISKYFLKYFIVGHGLRKIAIRLVPANELIRRSYPELIKWYR